MCVSRKKERVRNEPLQQPERPGSGADESDKEVSRQENCAAREHLEMMSTQSKRSTRTLGELPNKVYRLYSESWQTGKELLNGLQTVDKRRNNQRPSEQYAQPLLESKIYVARHTHIEAPARSTILRHVGLLEALSSAARSSLILLQS